MVSRFDATIESPGAPLLDALGDEMVEPVTCAIVRLIDPSPRPFSTATARGPLRLPLSERRG